MANSNPSLYLEGNVLSDSVKSRIHSQVILLSCISSAHVTKSSKYAYGTVDLIRIHG